MPLISKGPYRFDNFELEPSRRLLTRDRERIAISPKSFEVLLYLVEHSGQVVLKEELLKAVWPDSFVEESNLTQHIFWLRKSLKDRASYIATIPGRGYEFTADVQLGSPPALSQPVADSAQPVVASDAGTNQFHLRLSTETTRVSFKETLLTTPISATRSQEPSRRLVWLAALAAIVVLSLAGGGLWYRQHRIVPGDHHEVVLADFTNATPDHDFDRTLKTLLAIDLSQSPYLVVATDPQVHDTLNLMGRPPDTHMTSAIALEVCQRLNDQVVLSGQIASFGQRYAVSLSALDCQSGKALVQSKAVADNREGVVHAVDTVAATVRGQLGESLPLQSPDHPLLPVHTVSLDALRSYSQAMDMNNHEREAIPLFRRAVELDPQFAWGYAQLAGAYELQGEYALQREYLRKAYSMRDQLNDYQRFAVTIEYDEVILGEDGEKELVNIQSWSALYPNQFTPLIKTVQVLKGLGRFEEAIAPARRALALQPNDGGGYIELADSLAQAGHTQEAKAVCQAAFRRHLDSIFLHLVLYGIAIHEHDQAAIAAEDAWASNKDDGIAFPASRLLGEGKAHEAVARILRSVDDLRRQGFVEHADRRLRGLLNREAMFHMDSELRYQMKSVDLTKYPEDVIYATAELGRIHDAQRGLRLYNAELKQTNPAPGPVCSQPRAAVALAMHKPEEAIEEDLKPCLKYGMAAREPILLLGQAYLDEGKPQLAEQEFHYLLDHSFSGLGVNEAIARLGLARAIVKQGDYVRGPRAYEDVFEQWKYADTDFPLLLQARREYEAIPR